MDEIILYIFKKYGLQLSEAEALDLLSWYRNSASNLDSEEKVDVEVGNYLYKKYAGRPLLLLEEDLSHMKYLLALLKKQASNNSGRDK